MIYHCWIRARNAQRGDNCQFFSFHDILIGVYIWLKCFEGRIRVVALGCNFKWVHRLYGVIFLRGTNPLWLIIFFNLKKYRSNYAIQIIKRNKITNDNTLKLGSYKKSRAPIVLFLLYKTQPQHKKYFDIDNSLY